MASFGQGVSTLSDVNLDNLCFINFTNLQKVLVQIAAAVRQNAVDIQIMQDGLNYIQEDINAIKMSEKVAFQDINTEMLNMKSTMRTLASGVDISEMKFSLEQKNKQFEEGIAQLKDDTSILKEDFGTLTGETLKNSSDIDSIRKDLSTFKNDSTAQTQSIEDRVVGVDSRITHVMQENMNFVTRNELNVKVKDIAATTKSDLENIVEELHSKLRQQITDATASLESRSKTFVTTQEYEEVKAAIPEIQVSVGNLGKSNLSMTNELKAVKAYLEAEAKTVTTIQETLDAKADYNSVEDLAKYSVNTRSQLQALSIETQQLLQHHQTLQNQLTKGDVVEPKSTTQIKESMPPIQLKESTDDSGKTWQNVSGRASPISSPKTVPIAVGSPRTTPNSALTSTQNANTALPPNASAPASSLTSVPSSSLTPTLPNTSLTTAGPPNSIATTLGSPKAGPVTPKVANSSILPAIPPSPLLVISQEITTRAPVTFEGSFISLVSDAHDIPSPEVMYKEFREIQKAGVDVRKDLSDLAGLLEALTGEMKRVKETAESKESSTEIWHALDQHSQQVAHLLHTKADLSAIENMLSRPPLPSNAIDASSTEELEQLKEAINLKANKDELRKMKRALQKELEKTLRETQTHDALDGPALATRAHYRCLACDRMIIRLDLTKPLSVYNSESRPHTEKSAQPMTGSELAANVAWRRSQVKDLLTTSKHPSGMGTPNYPTAPVTPNSATSRSAKSLRALTASLPPIAQPQHLQRPKSTDGKEVNDVQ